jgi:malate dehydrogenase (oxaloacetate-decarboxylating)(NADP+)
VSSEYREAYAREMFRLRQRRGVTLQEAESLMNDCNVFGSMMVHMGDADALVSGVTQHFPDTIRPALRIVRMREGLHRVSGCYAVITRKGEVFFLADTSVNIETTAEDLVEIALCTAHMARRFDLTPRVAMLSFSSFGSVDHPIGTPRCARGWNCCATPIQC